MGFPPYILAVRVQDDDSWRMLIVVKLPRHKAEIIDYLTKDLEATAMGDWYVVATTDAGWSAHRKVHELDGKTYRLEES